jgi:hypothetical protein
MCAVQAKTGAEAMAMYPKQGNAADVPSKLTTPAPQIYLGEAKKAKTAVGPFENRGSTDELVRDLEDSGYPVDGSREEFIRRPDGLSVATGGLVAASVQLDKSSEQRTCATPSEERSRSNGDAPK